MAAGQRFSRVFAGPRTFPYFCVVHHDMTGTVEVVDASGTAPPPAPPSGVAQEVVVPEGARLRVLWPPARRLAPEGPPPAAEVPSRHRPELRARPLQ